MAIKKRKIVPKTIRLLPKPKPKANPHEAQLARMQLLLPEELKPTEVYQALQGKFSPPSHQSPHSIQRENKAAINDNGSAIRAYCGGCVMATNEAEMKRVDACADIDCALWVFRMGKAYI